MTIPATLLRPALSSCPRQLSSPAFPPLDHTPRPHPKPNHHQLFFHIRDLLSANQPERAAAVFLADPRTRSRYRTGQPGAEWLWKTARLFRSYDHPRLAVEAFRHLTAHLPLSTHAAVTVTQACGDLVWHSEFPQPDRSDAHALLAEALARLTARHPSHHSCPPQPAPPKARRTSTRLEPWSAPDEPTETTRTLEVVLATILKLGDLDWLVSIFRDFYPRFTAQLGRHLHPDADAAEAVPEDAVWEPAELPSGRLVRFLVSAYTLCGDLSRAYAVVRFHQRLCTGWAHFRRDLSPEMALLRGLARSTAVDAGRRLRMVRRVLEELRARPPDVDTYALDGLLDMRYRLRIHWALRRPHAAAFTVLRGAFEAQLRLFLLHRRRTRVRAVDGPKALVPDGQRPVASWTYRPSARSFTILLLSLRTHLRQQTRPVVSRADTVYHVDQPAETRMRSRRPSPGAHRALFAQLVALERLIRSGCGLARAPVSAALPMHFKLLTPGNANLLLDIFLLARDYAGAAVLLDRLVPTPTVLEAILGTVLRLSVSGGADNHTLAPLCARLALDLDALPSARELARMLSGMLASDPAATVAYLRMLLRACEPHQTDVWWATETAAVVRRVEREERLIQSAASKPALSEVTHQVLRKWVSVEQLGLICYGIQS